MKSFIKIIKMGLAAVLVLSLAACGASGNVEKMQEASTEEVSKADTICFGTNAEFPPFEYTSENGIIEGFDGIDIAIAKYIAEDNGKTLSISNIDFNLLIKSLQNDNVDAVIAGMTITDERKELVDFSEPYYTATQVMIVKEDSDIQKAADMKGKNIVVIQGYTGEKCVQDLGFSYAAYKKGSETIPELMNGNCDVIVIDSVTAQKFVDDNKGIKIVEDSDAFETEEYVIAVKKGNKELLDKINASISKMKEEGTISEISQQYMDVEVP